jgi:hypothetical protein
MEWLAHVDGWKVGLCLGLFALLFVFRGMSGGKPDLDPVRRRRRRR